MKTIRTFLSVVVVATLGAGCSERNDQTGPLSAEFIAGQTSVVADAVGDADKTAQAYLDIVRAEITKQGTNFVFVMTLAAPVPDNPELPSWADVLVWQPILETDPTSAADVLIDRRPLLTGGQAIVTPIKVSIDGAQITFVVDAALLGDPSTFSWLVVTSAAKAGDDVKNAYNKHFPFDQAPEVNSGAPLATWPQ